MASKRYLAFHGHRPAAALVIAATAGSFCATSALADTDSDALLQEELRKRDVIIQQLLQRVEQLERAQGVKPSASAPQPETKAAAPAVAGAPAQTATPQGQPPAGPGVVMVDERAADRALERTLVIQGALLLPNRVFEITPFTSYARNETDIPIFTLLPNDVAVSNLRVERDEFSSGINAAVGLPFDTQLELSIPYRYVEQDTKTLVGGVPTAHTSNSGSSFGDVRVGVAKTLLREDQWWPDVIGRLVWDTDTGDRSDGGVPLSIGFNEYELAFSALKRQDPLAFTANLSYRYAEEKDDIQPGQQFNITLGASLAASPETSLSIAIAQTFEQELKIGGTELEGSDARSSLLLFGASSVLGRRTLLSFNAGIGLTTDSPDYTLSFSLPMRFW